MFLTSDQHIRKTGLGLNDGRKIAFFLDAYFSGSMLDFGCVSWAWPHPNSICKSRFVGIPEPKNVIPSLWSPASGKGGRPHPNYIHVIDALRLNCCNTCDVAAKVLPIYPGSPFGPNGFPQKVGSRHPSSMDHPCHELFGWLDFQGYPFAF